LTRRVKSSTLFGRPWEGNTLGGDCLLRRRSRALSRAIAFGVALLAAPIAAAPEAHGEAALPAFDISASCTVVSDRATCEAIEGAAKLELATHWGKLSDKRKRTCVERGVAAGNSYVAVLSCAKGN
jgi:hypothetical protein